MNYILSSGRRFLSGVGAFIWMAPLVLVWSLSDQLRWHPRRTYLIVAAVLGSLLLVL
jgi:hypothetical protein